MSEVVLDVDGLVAEVKAFAARELEPEMRAVAPQMKRQRAGSIVNISSLAGIQGSPGAFAYGASKWAVRGMTKSAAID